MRTSHRTTDAGGTTAGRRTATRPGAYGWPQERIPVTVHAQDPISREGVLSQLRRHPELELREAQDTPRGDTTRGTVALLVVDTLDTAGLDRLRRAVRAEGARAVLVVRALRESALLDVMDCGVGAIVWRHEATGDRLARAVLAAARGGGDLPPDLLGRLIDRVGALHRSAPGRTGVPATGLTPREADVLRLVADGLDTAETAAALSCSERTVKNVLHGLTTRLRLRNRAHAVAWALREGHI
ncbi:response regulator transcription factor [Streptomyces marincola]|uniref:helix-turn-helix transcriptional regulator n=1 Tax=Streptomyces marincola TaxID=2878388 RepID=UPI003F6578A5